MMGDEPTIPTRERALERLRRGDIRFGPEGVGWGVAAADFQLKLDVRFAVPDRAWRQPPGIDGVSHVVEMPALWRDRCRVELVFFDERLASVAFQDEGWKSAEASGWDDLDYGLMVREYRASRDLLVEVLGPPDQEADAHETALSSRWQLGPSLLAVYCESRTPWNGIKLADADGPGAPRRGGG